MSADEQGVSRLIRVLVATVLAVASCSGEPPLEGIDLPPAEVPASVSENLWSLPFVAEMPAGYWDEGAHRYRFVIDCPPVGQSVASNPVEFRVTQLTPTLQGPVYLRLGGLSDGIIMPPNVGAIHPTQETIAAVTFLGLTQEVVDEATATCTGVLEFDGDQSEILRPGEPFRP